MLAFVEAARAQKRQPSYARLHTSLTTTNAVRTVCFSSQGTPAKRAANCCHHANIEYQYESVFQPQCADIDTRSMNLWGSRRHHVNNFYERENAGLTCIASLVVSAKAFACSLDLSTAARTVLRLAVSASGAAFFRSRCIVAVAPEACFIVFRTRALSRRVRRLPAPSTSCPSVFCDGTVSEYNSHQIEVAVASGATATTTTVVLSGCRDARQDL